jgi:hypothetical protein
MTNQTHSIVGAFEPTIYRAAGHLAASALAANADAAAASRIRAIASEVRAVRFARAQALAAQAEAARDHDNEIRRQRILIAARKGVRTR